MDGAKTEEEAHQAQIATVLERIAQAQEQGAKAQEAQAQALARIASTLESWGTGDALNVMT